MKKGVFRVFFCVFKSVCSLFGREGGLGVLKFSSVFEVSQVLRGLEV